MYLFYFCITISYNTLLVIDKPHAVAVEIGIAINPILVTDNVIEVDVVAIITIVSNDLSIVVSVLYFLYFFFDLLFLSLKKSNHFFNNVDMNIETVNITYFLF